jgi:hypothetical protein
MSNLSTLPKGDSAWLLRKAIERIIQQVSVLETNIGSSTTGNSANTQIIFNDNGTLRGDAGLTYNKTTDLLTVGAATITGDLTVDTSTLKVDSTNNRVGIGTASPGYLLDVQAATAVANILSTTGTNTAYLQISNTGGYFYLGRENSAGTTFAAPAYSAVLYAGGAYPLVTTVNGGERYRIASDGVATWSNVGGVAGTAMTLNSTGLGLGATPTTKLDVLGSGDGELRLRAGSDPALILSETAANKNWKIKPSSGDLFFQYSSTAYNSGYSLLMTLTSGGNVGIGGSPSSRLDVANSATPVVFSMTLAGVQRWQQIIDTSAGNWTLRDQTGSIDALIVGAGSGNVGIGVTPSYKLHVAGTGYFSSTLTLDGATRLAGAGSNSLNFNTNSVDRVTIDGSGNTIVTTTATAPSLGTARQMVFNLTSDTNLRISVRGTDGTTRTANITLT